MIKPCKNNGKVRFFKDEILHEGKVFGQKLFDKKRSQLHEVSINRFKYHMQAAIL